MELALRCPERVGNLEHVLLDNGEVGTLEWAGEGREPLQGVLAGTTAIGNEGETVGATRTREPVEVPLEFLQGGGVPQAEPTEGRR